MTAGDLPKAHQKIKYSTSNSKREKFSLLLERAIFFSALVLIALTAIPYGSVEFWWTSFFEIGAFALTILWAVQALFGDGYRRKRWTWLFLPGAALMVLCIIQSIPFNRAVFAGIANPIQYTISADPFETRSFAFRIAAVLLLGILLLRFTTTRARLHSLIVTVLGVGAASAIFGILRQAVQQGESAFVLPALLRGIGYAQIISRNQFAFMMEIAFGLALGMIFKRGGRFEWSLLYLSLALPIAAALILANSRGGIFTMMCQVLFLAALVVPATLLGPREEHAHKGEVRGRRFLYTIGTRVLLICALLTVATMGVIWVGGERVVSNLSTVTEELKPEDDLARWNTRRIDIWRATWRMIKDHPIAGVGFGGYFTAIPRYHDASGAYTPQQAHNDYLEILASGGVIGFGIFIWFMIVFVKRLRKRMREADYFRRAACFGALTGLFGVAVHSIFDFGLHLTINGALCLALIVIGTAEMQQAGERPKSLGV
jgi:putative inorganic carbon (hco3(-)) transporter